MFVKHLSCFSHNTSHTSTDVTSLHLIYILQLCLHHFGISLHVFINHWEEVLKYWTQHGSQSSGCHSRSHFSVKLCFSFF